MIKSFAPYMRKYRKAMILAPLTIICEVLLEVRIPILMAEIVDNGIPGKNITYVMQIGGLMVVRMSFPNGYDTDLGQGGANVSGGQKQSGGSQSAGLDFG